jgi:hypothetical protein
MVGYSHHAPGVFASGEFFNGRGTGEVGSPAAGSGARRDLAAMDFVAK